MHKTDHSNGNVQIFCPSRAIKEPLAIIEIGLAKHPNGFESTVTQRSSSTLFYLLSGEMVYNGSLIKAPSVIFISSNTYVKYRVEPTCDDFLAYWIKCSGDLSYSLLRDVGFSIEREISQIKNLEKVYDVFKQLTDTSEYEDANDSLLMLSGFYRLLALYSLDSSASAGKKLSAYTKSILGYIHQNFKENISEKDLAELVNLSTNHMHKVFLSDMKTTPINYLNSYRINRAKELLRETNLPISKVAEEVGISCGDYFCRVFRKYNDALSPTEYRKLHKS